MRFVRLLAIVIMVYGLTYVQFAIVQVYKELRAEIPGNINWYVTATNFNIGMIVFVVGIGLLLAKEWARILWLMSSIALLAVHVFFLWLSYVNGVNHTQQLLNAVLIIILLLISWIQLTRPTIKELFH